MKLSYCGHSCFLLDSGEGRLVLDPYEPESVPGLVMPRLEAELCLCSHSHHDHCFKEGIRLSGRSFPHPVKSFSSFHDEEGGSLRGDNRLHLICCPAMNILHLGDLGHELSQEQILALGRVDLLLLPVGGTYTLDPIAAHRLAAALDARIVVPMHYRGEGFGYEETAPLSEFLELAQDIVHIPGPSVELSAIEGRAVLVFDSFLQG